MSVSYWPGIIAGLLLFAAVFLSSCATAPTLETENLVSSAAITATIKENFKLTANDAVAGDRFGNSVALDGDTAIMGVPSADNGVIWDSGSAYVFTCIGGVWTQQAKLIASDASAHDRFGYSVALDGDTALVATPWHEVGGISSGCVYVFTCSGGVWTEQAKLTASDATAGDIFGYSVSASGDTALVGAILDDDGGSSSGSAYVFTRSSGVWTEQAKLIASDATAYDAFGYSVSVSGDTTLVGAKGNDSVGEDSGSAYVFTRSSGGWTQQQKLTASDAVEEENFGNSVSVSGDTAIVGAYEDDDGGFSSGSANVFTRSGGVWREQAKLTARDAAENDNFGKSVSVSDDTALVGAYGDVDAGFASGSAYVFTRSSGAWVEQAKLTASDAAQGDYFGTSVSLSGDTALVGANMNSPMLESSTGAAYVFDLAKPKP